MKPEKIRMNIFGRVQGVNFRRMVKRFCDRRGLGGFVKNNDDGSVEVVAYGSKFELEELVAWVKSSPGMSRVEKVIAEREKCDEKLESFEVRRDGSLIGDKVKGVKNLGKKLLKGDDYSTRRK